MLLFEIALIILTLFGSGLWCIYAFNQCHARSLPPSLERLADALIRIGFLAIPTVFVLWYSLSDRYLSDMLVDFSPPLVMAYAWLCLLMVVLLVSHIFRKPRRDRPETVLKNNTIHLDLRNDLGTLCMNSFVTRALSRLPGNQLLDLHVQKKWIRVPRLPAALKGLSIAHLTDLHFSAKATESYFNEIIRHTNGLNADLIAITGDLVHGEDGLEGIADVLGQLHARHGVYYVLGNHDRHIDVAELHQQLQAVGLTPLGSRWTTRSIRGITVVLAGNESPWFEPAADLSDCPSRKSQQQLRILLTHSPDQIQWARRYDADLVLAGHTHGGHICLPWIGSLASASRMGTHYVQGTFNLEPTVLHVCRGIFGGFPIRFNCPPELACLELCT